MESQYQKQYNDKLRTLDEVLGSIKDGEVICTAGVLCEPKAFYDNLHKVLVNLHDIELIKGRQGNYPFFDIKEPGHYTIIAHMFDTPMRENFTTCNISHMPCNLHNFIQLRAEVKPINKFVAMATPMDENGNFVISGAVMWEQGAYETAEEIILEINPNLPKFNGCVTVPIDRVSMLYEAPSEPRVYPFAEPNEIDMKIGGYIADLVHDYDCIQLGVGGIPNAVGNAFFDKKGLGLHSELYSPIMAKLIDAGVITGEAKQIDKGLHVGTFVRGDMDTYRTFSSNPNVMFKPSSYTNDPHIIAQIDNMVSINTALEVDLTGQVCSESIGESQFSGTGGASDFAYGAQHSKGGRGIIALKSTMNKGLVSKIKPILTPGAVVSISRNIADIIVTEYGVAYLRGRTVSERVKQLINIAHPDFRSELLREAKKLSYIL